jgi:hypothetical protein
LPKTGVALRLPVPVAREALHRHAIRRASFDEFDAAL